VIWSFGLLRGAAAATAEAPAAVPTAAVLPAEPALVPAERLDEEGFTALYHRLARPLRAYLRRLAGDAEAADDLLQETFYRFLRTDLPAGLDDRQTAAFLYRTATRLVQDGWRRAAVERRRREAEPPARETAPAADAALARDVERAMATLEPRQRALLWLAHVEGLDHREIAGVLGVAEASVKVLLHRARKRLAAALDRRGFPHQETRR
jgi:RNA polymerase sigma-70 factor, ECF subfamily